MASVSGQVRNPDRSISEVNPTSQALSIRQQSSMPRPILVQAAGSDQPLLQSRWRQENQPARGSCPVRPLQNHKTRLLHLSSCLGSRVNRVLWFRIEDGKSLNPEAGDTSAQYSGSLSPGTKLVKTSRLLVTRTFLLRNKNRLGFRVAFLLTNETFYMIRMVGTPRAPVVAHQI